MDCVRSSNLRLITVLSDDAEDGTESCRLNALNLLALLTSLARLQGTSYIIDALVKANVLEILIEPLKYLVTDFQDTDAAHRPHNLTLTESRMHLLLQLCLTHPGATAILDANFISSLRSSRLFLADPDIGLSQPTASGLSARSLASALHTYYTLLSLTLRVLLSILTSRGADNTQAQHIARTFLADYRSNMMGCYKRYVGVSGGKMEGRSRRVLGDVVKGYAGLAAFGGWTDWEDEKGVGGGSAGGFS